MNPTLNEPIDWTTEHARAAASGFLSNIQGSILQSHKRRHVRLLFVRFAPPTPKALPSTLRERMDNILSLLVKHSRSIPKPSKPITRTGRRVPNQEIRKAPRQVSTEVMREIAACLARQLDEEGTFDSLDADLDAEHVRTALKKAVAECQREQVRQIVKNLKRDCEKGSGLARPQSAPKRAMVSAFVEKTIADELKRKANDARLNLGQNEIADAFRRSFQQTIRARIQVKTTAGKVSRRATKTWATLQSLTESDLDDAGKKAFVVARKISEKILDLDEVAKGLQASIRTTPEKELAHRQRPPLERIKEIGKLFAELTDPESPLGAQRILVTSAQDESLYDERGQKKEEDPRKPKPNKPEDPNEPCKDDPFGVILLSFSGYNALGLDEFAPMNELFRLGMKNDRTYGATPDVGLWEHQVDDPDDKFQYRRDIDAVVLLASNCKTALDNRTQKLTEKLMVVCDEVWEEKGKAVAKSSEDPAKDGPREWFGFKDGISQPRFFKMPPNSKRGPATRWNDETPLNVVLTKDPAPGGGYGSFMVYQKLEQDVKQFKEQVAELSRKVGRKLEDVLAEAVGRKPNGEPRVDPKARGLGNPSDKPANDFDFSSDPDGRACPFHAHIRKVNPRGEAYPDPDLERAKEGERRMRIARRGITYGDREHTDEPDKDPTRKCGLLFMSFQSDIAQFVSHQWAANWPYFAKTGTGVDGLIGRVRGNREEAMQTWHNDRGLPIKDLIADNVTLRGGEYFFAPSISGLKALGKIMSNSKITASSP